MLCGFPSMFGSLFGWRKASKCKEMIKQLQHRLKLVKNRSSVIRVLRDDIARLIEAGREEIAFNRVEQLVNDENMESLYKILEDYCAFIYTKLKYIRKHKDCRDDINKAVSSLIFASPRCGDLPELVELRRLFRERYGQEFVTTADDVRLPENKVDGQVIDKLSIKSVSVDEKCRIVDQIAPGRRLSLRENPSIKDIQCEVFHDNGASNKQRSSNRHDMNHKKPSPIKQSSYAQKRQKKKDCIVSGNDLQSSNCITKKMGRPDIRRKPRRKDIGDHHTEHIVLTEQKEKTRKEKQMGSTIGKRSSAPNLKVITMPPERPKENPTKKTLRSTSTPFEKPEHVHPNLPDYDAVVSKL